MPRMRWLERLLLLLSVLLVVAAAFRWFYATNEDAWISLRYARNLADGFGLVSHPGGAHEEGYSDLAWVLLLAGARRFFGADLLITAKLLGVAALAGTALTARAVFRRLAGPSPASPLLVVAVGGSSFACFWATQGLETSLYSLEVMLLAYLYLCFISDGKRRHLVGLSLLLWLGWITRPEGAISFLVVFAGLALWAAVTRPGRAILGELAGALLLGVALVGLTLAWKVSYFGDTLANPSYIKLGLRRYGQFAPYALDYLRAKGLVFVVLLAASALAAPLLWAWRRVDRTTGLVSILLLMLVLSQVGFVWYVRNDYQLYARFFITHQAPALLLILIVATRRGTLVAVAVALALAHSAWREPVSGDWWWTAGFPSPLTALDDNPYGRSARRLSELMKDGGRYALSEYGYIPFHADGQGIDMMGLNSHRVARNFKYYPFEEVFYASRDHVLSQLPKVIITGGVYRLAPSPPPSRFEEPTRCDGEGCRSASGDLLATPGAAWFFAPYLESPYFRRHYTLEVPADRKVWEWTFFELRAPPALVSDLRADEPEHADQLLHGFSERGGAVWAASISRALLQPRPGDHQVCVEGQADRAISLQLGLDGEAVGDRLAGSFAQRLIAACAAISPGDSPFLLTMRASEPFRLRRIFTR